MTLELAYISIQEPPGYSNENVVGEPIERMVYDAIISVSPAVKAGHELDHWWRAATPELVNLVGCQDCLLFYDRTNYRLLATMHRNQMSVGKIRQVIERLLKLKFDGATGTYKEPNGNEYILQEYGGTGTGTGGVCPFLDLPFFGNKLAFLCDIGKYLWLGAAVVGGYKAATSKTKPGQYGFGALALYAGWQYLKR